MYCHKDSLSGLSQLSEEPNYVVGSLAVKSQGRLIQEDQDTRLSHQFHANRQALPLLDRETGSWSAHQGVLEIVKFEEVDDCVYIAQLVRVRGISRLAQEG